MKKYCYIWVLLQVILVPFRAYSQTQESYDEILVRANKYYEEGNFSDAITEATSCNMKGASTSNRWKAQRLLAMTYLADGQAKMARAAAEEMLELNPTYVPSKLKDPTELVKLLNSIKVIPKFSLGMGVSIGSNTTFTEVDKSYVVADYLKTYTGKNAYQVGLTFGYSFNPKISVDLCLNASQKSYNIQYGFSDWNVAVSEKLTYMDVPLQLKYTFRPYHRFRFFFQGGAYAGYLLVCKNSLSSSNEIQHANYELKNLNSASRRNLINYGLVGGIGLTYKTGQGHVFLQANYFRSFSNITKENTRYDNNELLFTYYYLDDNIKLHNMAVSIGYSFYMNYKVVRK